MGKSREFAAGLLERHAEYIWIGVVEKEVEGRNRRSFWKCAADSPDNLKTLKGRRVDVYPPAGPFYETYPGDKKSKQGVRPKAVWCALGTV